MSEMPHPIASAWLSAYYDEELDAARREQLEAHLAGCLDCQQALAALKSLSEALSADEMPAPTPADDAAFWRRLKPELPDRVPARQAPRARAGSRNLLLRWAPGIGLLFLNGVVDAAAAVGTLVMFVASRVSPAPAWAHAANWLAADASLGWLAWILPAAWSGLGLLALFAGVSAALAVLYLAWLAYELRYGASAAWQTAA